MKVNPQLHWSFDYNYNDQNDLYAQELVRTIYDYVTQHINVETFADRKHTMRNRYKILPNFWRGYKRNDDGLGLCIGEAVIERELGVDNVWNYNVHYKNTTSGENLTLNFSCENHSYRSLLGNWHVEAYNSCNDDYSKLIWNGCLSSEKEVQLILNDTEICIGSVDSSAPLICNWSLFDVIPELAEKIKKTGTKEAIVLIDDLEQLRSKCKLGFLGTIDSPIPLDGFYLYGSGLLPSYWWVDENKNIVVVSNVFDTLVLTEQTRNIS